MIVQTRRTFSKGLLAGALLYAVPPLRWLQAGERNRSTDIASFSATRLSQLIRKGELGALELLELYLKRVERLNSEFNAII